MVVHISPLSVNVTSTKNFLFCAYLVRWTASIYTVFLTKPFYCSSDCIVTLYQVTFIANVFEMSNKGQVNLWDHLHNILLTFCHKYVLGSETLWYMYCHNSAWLSTACNHRVHDEKLICIFYGASFAVTYLHIHTDNIFKGNFLRGLFHHVLMVGRCYPPLHDTRFLVFNINYASAEW